MLHTEIRDRLLSTADRARKRRLPDEVVGARQWLNQLLHESTPKNAGERVSLREAIETACADFDAAMKKHDLHRAPHRPLNP